MRDIGRILVAAQKRSLAGASIAGDSENEFNVDNPEEVVDSEDEWAPTTVAKTPGKRLRPAKSTPAIKKKEPKVSYVKNEKEIPPKKERGSKAKPPPPEPIRSSSRGRGRATKVLTVEPEEDSEDDEEEVGDSEDICAPTAVAKTPGKRLRPAKSTPARKKKEPKVSYVKNEKEIPPKKERGSNAKPPPPAPIRSSSRGRGRATKVLEVDPGDDSEDCAVMMKSKKVLAGDSENEFDVDNPEEVGDSEDKWAPTAVAKTPGKRLRPAKSTPARKKKESKVSYVKNEKEIPPKKERGSKAKPPPPAPIRSSSRSRGRATKVLTVDPDEDSEDDEEEVSDDSEKEFRARTRGRIILFDHSEEGWTPEDEGYVEEELYQGPNTKPAKKFSSGAFVVRKGEMYADYPNVWKIGYFGLWLERYIPFKQDGKVLYKNNKIYTRWSSHDKEYYYNAPVTFIKHTKEEHIIEFYKDKIKKVEKKLSRKILEKKRRFILEDYIRRGITE